MDKKVTIKSKYALKGTLSIPDNKEGELPAVLFLHGAGIADRNENGKQFVTDNFKHLSEQFEKLGFISLRYDKRGCGDSEGDFLQTNLEDLIYDAFSALNALKSYPQVNPDKILLVGHNEGCILASAINEKINVQGIIFISGFTSCILNSSTYELDGIIKEINSMKGLRGATSRLFTNSEKLKDKSKKMLDKILQSNETIVIANGRKLNSEWFKQHKAFDIPASLSKIKCPTLAVVGSKDIQVSPEETKLMKDIMNCPFEFHIIDDMNHLLRNQAEPLTFLNANTVCSRSLKVSIDPKLIEIINNWASNFLHLKE